MPRIRALALVLALVLALAPAASQAAGTRMRVSVYAKLISNDHVGNEWTIDVDIPGQLSLSALDPDRLPASGWVSLSAGGTLKVTVTVTEDEAYPDVATDTITRKISSTDLRSGFDLTIPLTVVEDKGRYKGNTAEWQITLSFRP